MSEGAPWWTLPRPRLVDEVARLQAVVARLQDRDARLRAALAEALGEKRCAACGHAAKHHREKGCLVACCICPRLQKGEP